MAELVHISVVLNKVIEELIGLRDSISTPNDAPVKEVKEPIKTIACAGKLCYSNKTDIDTLWDSIIFLNC